MPKRSNTLAHGGVRLVDHGKHDVLDGDVFVLHALRLIFGFRENGVNVGGNVDFSRFAPRPGYGGQLFHLLLHRVQHGACVKAHFCQKLGNQPVFLPKQRVGQMFLLNLHTVVFERGALRLLDGFERFVRKILCVHERPSFAGVIQRIRESFSRFKYSVFNLALCILDIVMPRQNIPSLRSRIRGCN